MDLFYVVPGRSKDILGDNFLRPLQVIINCGDHSVSVAAASTEEYFSDFQDLLKEDLGDYRGPSHRIQLGPDVQPSAVRLRPIPMAQLDAVKKEIISLDQQGVWEPVDYSEWAHPMVVVPKKEGGLRITSDLTRLNRYVIPERFPLPRIKDLISNLGGAQFFSKIDLRKSYHQIQLHPDSRPLTTTITPLGLRQYKRLPMGLKDSASAFQRRVSMALQGLPGVQAYIDNIIVFGWAREEHDQNLRGALRRLHDTGFRIQEKKL